MQVLDPALPAFGTYFGLVQVVNEDGPRFQQIMVRSQTPGLQQTEALGELLKLEARKLGFFPTGAVELG